MTSIDSNEAQLYGVEVSQTFLKSLTTLTKASIKVYLSLIYLKQKHGNDFIASHNEVSNPSFVDGEWSRWDNTFGIRSGEQQYYKAFHQLQALGLIEVTKSFTPNGKPMPNQYKVL